jgi:competence protein ComEA
MIPSLLLKLGMLTVALLVVFWIGWTVPVRPQQESLPLATQNPTGPVLSPATSTVPSGTISLQPQKSGSRDKPPHSAERLNLNRATVADLESLPGIGPVLAGRIVEYRQSKGAFHTVQELKLVKGIGARKFDRIQSMLEVIPAASPAGKDHTTT